MTRGRKRKPDATIPAHIDQASIPRGIYWRPGHWFVFDRVDGRPKRKDVATPEARLSDYLRPREWLAELSSARDT